MLIHMLETRRGSEDGSRVRRFEKGDTYDVASPLARDFMRKGWAYSAEPGERPPAAGRDTHWRAPGSQRIAQLIKE